jgi:DNA-binding NtrC family response regulator
MKELMELIMANLTKEDFGVTEITAHLRISRSLLHMKLKSLTDAPSLNSYGRSK